MTYVLFGQHNYYAAGTWRKYRTYLQEWKKIYTEVNIADLATKWVKGTNFDRENAQFLEPQFLVKPERFWPNQEICRVGLHVEQHVPLKQTDLAAGESYIACSVHRFINSFNISQRMERSRYYINKRNVNLRRRNGTVQREEEIASVTWMSSVQIQQDFQVVTLPRSVRECISLRFVFGKVLSRGYVLPQFSSC